MCVCNRIKSDFEDGKKADLQVGCVEVVRSVCVDSFCDGNKCGFGGVVSPTGLFCVQVGEGGGEMEVLSSQPKSH